MLTYNLENREKTPLYEYLYCCIRDDIRSRNLKKNEKLPSKRDLAANLGISIITVQNAYEQLLLEGYIYSIEKKGYFVSELIGNEQEQKMLKIRDKAVEKIEYLVDFSSNHTQASRFPFSAWAKCMRQTISDYEQNFAVSPPRTGVAELQEAISEHLRSYRNLKVDPERIIIGAGTEYLYGLIVRLLGSNRMIAVEDPGHLKIAKVYESNGVKVVRIPVDNEGLRVDRLSGSNVSCVHISPSHHFPTGIVMPANRRYTLIEWARQQKSYIIEDDYDSEFRFTGRPLLSMASVAPDQVIYMNTFSKTLLPSIRIAYMILPEKLMERYQEKLGFYSNTVSSLEQYTLARFISDGYYERYINRMRNYYRNQRDLLIRTLKQSPLNELVMIEEENAGLHFILGIKRALCSRIDDEMIRQKLQERRINLPLVSEYCYNTGKQFSHKFIVNYSEAEADHLAEAFEIMYEIISESIR